MIGNQKEHLFGGQKEHLFGNQKEYLIGNQDEHLFENQNECLNENQNLLQNESSLGNETLDIEIEKKDNAECIDVTSILESDYDCEVSGEEVMIDPFGSEIDEMEEDMKIIDDINKLKISMTENYLATT